ncbi:flagellar biosynthesis protein FliQ [bacterium]|nr:flagellar biosynthesis protein FliQ [bacterium]
MEGELLDVASQAIQTALYMALPVLAISLLTGFTISIFQAVTSIQEQTMTFVPKIFVTGLVLIFASPWMFQQMNTFATGIFGNLGNYVR